MDFSGDPFRTLGVGPDASISQIKSAYRRLAKQYHPDTAGERALPRFLAIQAAYERLVDGEGRLRSQGGDPWRADPARARASRDAWRARRYSSASSAAGATRGQQAPGSAKAGGAGKGTASAGGPGSTAEGERPRRRGPRKATPGSTSYDEAAETPLDPAWDGGAWYGPSSGTYWTINPREYADPRKHGPEYLARARRAATADGEATPEGGVPGDAAGAPAAEPPPGDGTQAAADAGEQGWHWTGSGPTTTGGDTANWAARAWTYDTRDPSGTTWTPGGEARARRASRGAPAAGEDAPPLPDLESIARRASPASLLARARRPGWHGRLLIALLGWPPIGFAIATLVSDSTGCARYAASCPDEVPGLLLIVQVVVIGVLYAVPVVAAVAAFATLASLAIALPVAAVLAVGSQPRGTGQTTLLGVATTLTYLAAFAGAASRLWRRPRAPDPAP
jgi:hypothetical protein